MRVVLNGKEIKNPIAKILVGFIASCVALLIVFILLPFIGITIAFAVGVFLATLFGVLTMLMAILLSLHRLSHRQLPTKDKEHILK